MCTHWWSWCENLAHPNHALWMVTRIHSGGKLHSYVLTDEHNVKALLIPTMTCGRCLGFTQRVSCVYVYTLMIMMWKPCHSNHALWTVTRIISASKLCSYVHTDDHNVKIPTMHCGWWLGFTQPVSCAHMYTLVIIMWKPYSFQPCPVDGDSDSLSL